MLESMPRGARSTPTPPADATSTETVVALDLAKTQTLSDCGELCGPEYPFALRGGLHRPEQALGWLGGSQGGNGAANIADYGSAEQG